jgi:hypothetical protein
MAFLATRGKQSSSPVSTAGSRNNQAIVKDKDDSPAMPVIVSTFISLLPSSLNEMSVVGWIIKDTQHS